MAMLQSLERHLQRSMVLLYFAPPLQASTRCCLESWRGLVGQINPNDLWLYALLLQDVCKVCLLLLIPILTHLLVQDINLEWNMTWGSCCYKQGEHLGPNLQDSS